MQGEETKTPYLKTLCECMCGRMGTVTKDAKTYEFLNSCLLACQVSFTKMQTEQMRLHDSRQCSIRNTGLK